MPDSALDVRRSLDRIAAAGRAIQRELRQKQVAIARVEALAVAIQRETVICAAQVGALPDPRTVPCELCGVLFRSEQTKAEHVYVAHDGPEPAHWLEAEKRAAL